MTEPLTFSQYKATLDLQRDLVRLGMRPDRAAGVAKRAALRGARGLSFGLGKAAQTRSFRRGPGDPPRPTFAGDRCVTLTAGAAGPLDTRLQTEIDRYRAQGWTVIDVPPYQKPYKHVTYACPPGQMPMENQPLLVSAQVF